MLVLCPKCWTELNKSPVVCSNCGTEVDLYSREYERRLLAALPRCQAERRAQICWILGRRGKRSSVPALMELLHDPDTFVRIAALRALGEIGDESAMAAVEKLGESQNLAVRTVARQVLKVLSVSSARPSQRRAG
jgi:HEAT repeat protein